VFAAYINIIVYRGL